jgi:HTTM domain
MSTPSPLISELPPGPADAPAARARRLAHLRKLFVERYLTADVRSLAAGRVALALVLILDLFKRWVEIGTWYTNDGLVPNHTLMWRPPFGYGFSFFFLASNVPEAVVGFVICLIAYLALLVGLRTRLAQVASTVCVLSLHGRLLLFDNGGDVALGLLSIWTTFLPTGRAFSIDALLASRDGGPEAEGGPRSTTWTSLAVLAVTCQLALIYFFNAIHKSGDTWRDGTAVHYALHLDRLATPLAVWMRARMTLPLSRVLTWSALGIEWSLPWLLLSPFAQRGCKRLAVLLVLMLHGGFGVFMNLGVFVFAMIAYTPNFIPGDDWGRVARWWSRSASRARFTTSVKDAWYAFVLRGAALFSRGRSVEIVAPGPAVLALRRRAATLREVAIGFLLFLAANQLFDENQAAHHLIDHHNSRPVAAAVAYLNLFQGWSMFAPDMFKGDYNVVVDAVTNEGHHVDPFSEAANPRHPFPGDAGIPAGLEPNWLFYQYAVRIEGHAEYRQAFQEWILRYPERAGHRGERIVSFRVLTVRDDSPPPSGREPSNVRSTLLFDYREP